VSAVAAPLLGCDEEVAPSAGPPVVVTRRYVDVTREVGVNLDIPIRPDDQVIGAVGVADVNGDGRLDLIFTHEDPRPTTLYLAEGTGYVERGAQWGFDAIRQLGALTLADFDGDGRPDLVATTNQMPTLRVYRNTGARFERVTPDPDPNLVARIPSVIAADLDGNGLLDIVAGAQSLRGPDAGTCPRSLLEGCPARVRAFRQTAPWRFEDVPVEMPTRRTQTVQMLDWDGDGRDEIVAAADIGFVDGGNFVLRVDRRADGTVRIVDASAGTGIDLEITGMGVAAIDIDEDGLDEVLMTNIGANVLYSRRTRPARDVARAFGADAYGVLLPEGPPTFRPLDPENALEGALLEFHRGYLFPPRAETPTTKWTPLVFDYDDDGHDDLYIAASPVGFAPFIPEARQSSGVMLQGNGRRLTDVTARVGLDRAAGHISAVAADLDGDLDLDLVLHHPAFYERPGGASVHRNEGPPTRGITVVARGRGGMRDGIGAMVEVRAGGRTRRRRIDGASGTYGCGPHEVRFGLGALTAASEVIVRFPSGAVARRANVPAGRIVIEE
jgi:hypothetical protein